MKISLLFLFFLLYSFNGWATEANYQIIKSNENLYLLNVKSGTLKKLVNDRLKKIEQDSPELYPREWSQLDEFQINTFWLNNKVYFKLVLFNDDPLKYDHTVLFKKDQIVIGRFETDSETTTAHVNSTHANNTTTHEGYVFVSLDEYLSYEDCEVKQNIKSSKGQLEIKKLK